MGSLGSYFRRTFDSLSIRNFRLYAIAQGISMSGTWMQNIAQALLVLRLTDSGTALGAVIAVQTLPILILGPWGGVVVDRFPRRTILYATQAASCTISLTVGILTLGGWIQLWMIFVFGSLLGLVRVFDQPTQQVFVRELVGREHLANAVSLNATEQNVARALGPTAAGILVATVGLGSCFIYDGLSYLVVVFMLHRMSMNDLHAIPPVKAAKGQLIEGLRYVRSSRVLFNLLIMMGLIGMFTYEFSVILPLLAEYTFHSPDSGYAILTGAMGVGSVAGGLYAASHREGTPRKLAATAVGFGGAVWLVAASPTLLFAGAAMLVVGFFSINFLSMGNVALQLESKPEMQGRVMALYTVAFLGTTPIGGPIQGLIAQLTSPRISLVVGGSAAIVAAGLGLMAVRRRERDLRLAHPISAAD